MENWLGQHTKTVSFAFGLILLAVAVFTRDTATLAAALVAAALLLFVIGLLGDRLKKAPGGFEFYKFSQRVSEKVLADRPPPEAVTGTAIVTLPKVRIEGTGTVSRTAEDTVGSITEEVTASVIRGGRFTADAVIAAADAMKSATTPEDLADRVAQYVSLRTVPGLRALSPGRIRCEQHLFGRILELQTLRSQGAKPKDARLLAVALSRIDAFWSQPEAMSDEAVEEMAALVRNVSENMVPLPVPESFRLLGMKAELAGEENPCPVCAPLRGNLYDPNDPDAPRPPIPGCEHERGCTCRYV